MKEEKIRPGISSAIAALYILSAALRQGRIPTGIFFPRTGAGHSFQDSDFHPVRIR